MSFNDLPNKVLGYYASQAESKTRGYIGASILGHACERRIWLDWQGACPAVDLTPIEILKTGNREEKFDRGRHEEERLIKALEGAGYLVGRTHPGVERAALFRWSVAHRGPRHPGPDGRQGPPIAP